MAVVEQARSETQQVGTSEEPAASPTAVQHNPFPKAMHQHIVQPLADQPSATSATAPAHTPTAPPPPVEEGIPSEQRPATATQDPVTKKDEDDGSISVQLH